MKSMDPKKIQIYDTTLRDGSQSEGISFSVQDKLLIAKKIDAMGFDFIEGGWPGANPKDIAFFEEVKKIKFKHAVVVAFGSTRKAHTQASQDDNLKGLLNAQTEAITIFGKSWDMHVSEVFKIPLEENLNMIQDSVQYLASKGKRVIYDAEHFFDGYTQNPRYALKTLETALNAGAETLVLCDTNGGTITSKIFQIVSEVHKTLKHPLGIHTHNDAALAVANALAAVEAGAVQVQGTVNGFGERCGNCDLIAVVANLQLKMGHACLPNSKLKELTELARYVNEVSNMVQPKNQPYVGQSAFAHKGGVHINAVMKNPVTYEHVDPSLVGNHRRFLVSEVGGRTHILLKAKELEIDLKKDSPETHAILKAIQEKEKEGYQYESAEASFELLLRQITGKRKKYFSVQDAEIKNERIGHEKANATASVTLKVADKEKKVNKTGDGPVDALGKAFREALLEFYPEVDDVWLDDYKVRIVNSSAGTAAKVRVTIEFHDKKNIWTTVGVSTNIIEASWEALVDAYEFKLMKEKRD